MNHNPALMGAWLLGYDVVAIANQSTIETIARLINSKTENLILQMAKSLSGYENAMETTETLLNSFTKGFQKPMHQ
jgi:predicted nucleotidyltransferase